MKIVSFGNYIYGYSNGGREQVLIANNVEQICAFIMKYRYENVLIKSIFDEILVETSMGSIQNCRNQDFLKTTLIPTLAPMQRGETEIPEFVPFGSEDEG